MNSTTATSPGRLTAERLDAALAALCADVGLDHHGADLIKFTNNAVLRLTTAPVVVRIAASQAVRQRVDKVINVARWLADHDYPSVRLLDGINQPVHAGGHIATFWQAVPPDGSAPTTAELADLLTAFHALPSPPFTLPAWNPIPQCRTRLDDAEGGLRDDEADYLRRCCDDIEAELADLRYELPPGPIHGDAFLGNLIPSPAGPVICDFDSTSTGPREWDLMPVALGPIRMGASPERHQTLASRYGHDITTWDGFPTFVRTRELQLVTSVIPILRSNPRIVDQWRHRLDTFRAGDYTKPWQPYS